MTFYTAVLYGNKKKALDWLRSYSEEITFANNILISRYVFDMLCAILTGIKMEKADVLADQNIPAHGSYKRLEMGEDLFQLLAETVSTFCDCIDLKKRGGYGYIRS